jgi:hypothetical protein
MEEHASLLQLSTSDHGKKVFGVHVTRKKWVSEIKIFLFPKIGCSLKILVKAEMNAFTG